MSSCDPRPGWLTQAAPCAGYVVRESVGEIVDKVRSFRASVVLLASRLEHQTAAEPVLRLAPDPDGKR